MVVLYKENKMNELVRKLFNGVDTSMLWKLTALHVLIIAVSNALVNIPVEIFGFKLTWAAFTFPLVVVATDLTVRLLGKNIARRTIAFAYPLAIIASILVVLFEGAPASVALRIGFASATAYALGTFLDVYVFQHFRERWPNVWWTAPTLSSIAANLLDTYTFFGVAFYQSADKYMAENWTEIATSQLVLKIVVSLIVVVPLYGLFLNFLMKRVGKV